MAVKGLGDVEGLRKDPHGLVATSSLSPFSGSPRGCSQAMLWLSF